MERTSQHLRSFQNCRQTQGLAEPVPLHAPLKSWVMSTQLALFFILSGMPNPQPESSSSTADLITIATTEDKQKNYKTIGLTECAFKHVILHGFFKFNHNH